jgi:hypothetical protein
VLHATDSIELHPLSKDSGGSNQISIYFPLIRINLGCSKKSNSMISLDSGELGIQVTVGLAATLGNIMLVGVEKLI